MFSGLRHTPLRLCLTHAAARPRAIKCARRWNSTSASSTAAAHDGPPVSETNRAEATMKRFWDTVGIETRGDALMVTLDQRTLKTPAGNMLLLPPNKSLLATLIAAEWDHQEKLLKPHTLPMTSITSRALDALVEAGTRAEVQKALLNYLDTDTICFHEDYPPPLVKLQKQHWDPLLEWAEVTFGVTINKFGSILLNAQPAATKAKLGQVLAGFDHWQLAAMERATYTTKSFIIALALVTKHLTVEQAALAAQVEVASQIERWGEVEDTHDVDYHDVRRQLGSVACLLSNV